MNLKLIIIATLLIFSSTLGGTHLLAVTPSEEAAAMRDFKDVDTNGDNRITVDELQVALYEEGYDYDKSEIIVLAGDYDTNNSGTLDSAEFQKLWMDT